MGILSQDCTACNGIGFTKPGLGVNQGFGFAHGPGMYGPAPMGPHFGGPGYGFGAGPQYGGYPHY